MLRPNAPSQGLDAIAGRLVRSAGAASVSQIWRVGVTFATHMALRRMIPPDEMGVWTWAEPLFLLLAQVRDLGLPGHVVRDRERPFGTFFAVELRWGGALTALVLVAAPLLALAYHDTDAGAVSVIRALCLFLFVQGLGQVPMVFFESEIEVQRTIPAELARNTLFAILSLSLAMAGFGVWSLIWAHIAAGALYAAMLWWAVRGRLPLDRRAPSLRTLLTASVPLAAMALLEQAVLKLDAFVLGLRFPSEVVGTAGLAVYAVFFFPRMLADSIGRALYPALVRFGEDPPRLFDAFRVATVFLASFSVPMSFFLFVNAELAVLFLGGDRWLGAADYLRILSLVPLVRPLAMFGLELLLTRHMDRLLIAYTATNLLALGGLGLYLTSTDLGPNGMAVAGYFPLGLLFLTWGIWRLDRSGLLRLGRELLEIDGIAAALFLPIWWLIPATAAWTRFGLSAVAGLVVVAFAAWRFGSGWRRFLEGASA